MSYIDYVLESLSLFREFDMSNYISNAKYSIKNKYNIKSNKLILGSSIKSLRELAYHMSSNKTIVPDVLAFYGSCNKNLFDSLPNTFIHAITVPDVSDIKPQYINSYITHIGKIIDDTLNGKDTRNDVIEFTDASSINKMRKQVVKTTLSYDIDPAIALKCVITKSPSIQMSSAYVQKFIIPFLKSYENNATQIINDISSAISIIEKCERDIMTYNETIENIRKTTEFDNTVIKRINYVTYNCYRALADIVFFMTVMICRKVNYNIQNLIECIKIKSIYENVMSNNPVIEAVSETILPEDTNNLKEDLMEGRADAYESISNNIYEYNSGILKNSPESPLAALGSSVEGSIETSVDNAGYDRTDYEEASKIFIIISKGLDIISQYSDDYLLVFDDIIDKAGFQVSLNDRFKTLLDGFDDVEEYTSAANLPTESVNIYFKMLADVKSYGENMTKIAKNIYDCRMKIETLETRFNNNINGEYANAEAINELKIFMENFKEEFDKLVNIVAGKFMLRLKNINIALEVLNNKRIENADLNDDVYENTNFNDLTTLESMIADYNAITDVIFENLAKEYTIAKEMKNRGCKIVFEADAPTVQPATGTTNTTQTNGAQTTATTTTTQTVAQTAGKPSFQQKILEQLNEWFTQLTNKLNDILNGQMAKKDREYIQKFKDELLSKDYTNLSTSQPILNYETLMPYNNILNDLNGLKGRVNVASFQKLNSSHSKDDVIKLLFPSSPPATVFNSNNVADAITQYYKVGTNTSAQPMNFSGDTLKSTVTNAVTYCENCYDTILPAVRQNIQSIKTNLEASMSTIVKENGYDITLGLLFTEADANATTNSNTQNNAKNVNNMNDKINYARNYITQYCNAVLTAIFDRQKDYMALLKTFVSDSNNTQ